MRKTRRRSTLQEEEERLRKIYKRNIKIYVMSLTLIALTLVLAKRMNPSLDITTPIKILMALIGGWILILVLTWLRGRKK
ncbi:MAG: hypothetical protein J7M13_07295 [Synergistetes bacterium]|nr:hypothetical protein [Synergistota bacterium]